MLTITPEALELIRKQDKPIFLELPKLINSCCFDLQECPTIRFGHPWNPHEYEKRKIMDTTVLVPQRLPDVPLTIAVSSFLGIKRLVVEGWCYFG